MTQPFRYISLGAGVQSSAVLVMSALGLYGCPKADVAIFADTQDEPKYVYSYLATLKAWAGEHGIKVETVTAGSVSAHQLDPESTRSLIPAFTVGADGRASMLLRMCTQEHKIQPIERRVRKLLGFQPRQRIKARLKPSLGSAVTRRSG